MKKIISLVVIFCFIFMARAEAGIFGGKFDKIPSRYTKGITIDTNKREIIKLLRDMNRYANKKDLEPIKNLYDEKYRSSDGFDYETYMKLTEETFKAYPNIKYKTKIDDIVITDDYAIVKMSDYTTAKLGSKKTPKDEMGHLKSICKYTTYLVKRFDEWKILYDNIEFEESAIKYGNAKKIDIRLDTPAFVESNKDYEISLSASLPKNVYATASIGNEEIEQPDSAPKEKFRKIKSDIPLERVVRANKNGHNEYAIASVGFTTVTITEDKSASLMNFAFRLSGMAFLMRRVNLAENFMNLGPNK